MALVSNQGVERDSRLAEWTITNYVADLIVDCTADNAALARAFGTLIHQLITKGIISGTVNS